MSNRTVWKISNANLVLLKKKKMQCHSAVMENKSGILLNWEITDGGIETDKCNRF